MSLKELEIEQEGIGRLELQEQIPRSFQRYVLPGAKAYYLEGDGIKAIFQVLIGKGSRVWFSRYWTTKAVVLKARGGIALLELRMSWRNQIKGTWEKISQMEVPESYYQFGFVPHTITKAIFEANAEYQTFDVHFDLDFFGNIGLEYKMFQQFIEHVIKDQPAELYPAPKKCPAEMIDSAYAILRNSYSRTGKELSLFNNISNILLAALEDADPEGLILPALTPAQYEAILYAKQLIDEHFPKYLGNDVLCRRTKLNFTYFMLGFRRVFGENPHTFYNLMRMDRGKDLLRQGYKVKAVALELEYESDRSFSKAFKQHFNISPKEYQLRYRH